MMRSRSCVSWMSWLGEVHADVIANGFKFKTITVRIRYEHFDTHTSSKSLSFSTNDLDILRNNAKRLIAPFLRGE